MTETTATVSIQNSSEGGPDIVASGENVAPMKRRQRSPEEDVPSPAKKRRQRTSRQQAIAKKEDQQRGNAQGDKVEVVRPKAKAKAKAKKASRNKAKAHEESGDVLVDVPPEKTLSSVDSHQPLLRMFSWNVNGARALAKKPTSVAFLHSMLLHPETLAVGVQEIKCSEEKDMPAAFHVNTITGLTSGVHSIYPSTTKKGYSGVWACSPHSAPLSITLGMGTDVFDGEGRCVTYEFEDFYFVNVYVPNASSELKRLDERCDGWEQDMLKYLGELQKKKPIIYCGDLNVACSSIELANPKSNYDKSAGYTQREINAFDRLTESLNLVDAFRYLYPEKLGCYTYWGYRFNARAKNIGWRMDYFMISKSLLPALQDVIHHTEVTGSDHCPIEIQINRNKL